MSQEQSFEALRNAIEAAVDRKMRSPRDFDFLAQAIFEKVHQPVSTSTLKRFWGYLPRYASTRTSTLDLLSQFLDYKDWEHFCYATGAQPALGARASSPANNERAQTFSPAKDAGVGARAPRWARVLLLIIIIVVGGVLLFRSVPDDRDDEPPHSRMSDSYILRRGQIFQTYSDYLQLFGITSADNYWDCPLPHHDGIIIWSPKYHHPQWHNDGQTDSLMPTITEWWEPADSIDAEERQTLMAERNAHLYFTVMRTNELRITFMKNLTDTGYVFLGIYRTNLDQSDSTHVVWERIADVCDLSRLDYLQQLRH